MIRDQADRLRQLITVSANENEDKQNKLVLIQVKEGFYAGEYTTKLLGTGNELFVVATPKREGRIIFLAVGTQVRIQLNDGYTYEGCVSRRTFDNLPSLHIEVEQPEHSDIGTIDTRSKRVMVVTSGKGGVGKTTVSVNLSLALVELGYRVTLLDADIGLANVDVLLGINPRYNLGHVLRGDKTINEIAHVDNGLRVIAGGSGIPDLFNLQEMDLQYFVNSLEELEDTTDILLIDTGAGISPQVMRFVEAADDVLIVCTPEPTSLTDAYALIKVLSNQELSKDIQCIVNRARDEDDARATFRRLALTSEKFLGVKLRFRGWLVDDAIVVKSIREQYPMVQQYPNSRPARNIISLAKALTEQPLNVRVDRTEEQTGIKGFFNKLTGFLK